MAGMMGFGGFGGQNIGQALIRVGADFRGMQAQTAAAMGTMKAQMNAATANLSGATAETQRLNQRLAATEQQAVKAGKAIKILAFGIGAIGVGIAAMAVKQAVSFESAFAGVEKTVDGTKEQLAALRRELLEMSKTGIGSANDLAAIGEAAGALGIPLQNIEKFTKVVATMAQTTDVSTDQAATALGQLSNVLKLTADDYSRFSATLVDLGNNGASTESQILQMASRAGGAGKLIGLANQSILAMSSATANLGIRVEAGGSSLQKFFLELNKGVGEGKKNLKLMADITGMTKDSFAALFNADAEKAIVRLLEGLGRLDKTARQSALGDLGMDDIRITRMLLGFADNVDMVKAALDRGHIAWEANTAAAEEFAKRERTAAFAMGKIRNILSVSMIDLGTEGLDGLKEILSVIADELPKAIDNVATLWREHLAEPFSNLGDAAEKLFGTIIGAFAGGEQAGGDMGGVLEMLVSGLGTFVDLLAKATAGIAALLDNQVMQSLIRLAAVFGALAIGAKALGGLKGLFAGLGKGAAMKMGMGRFLPGMDAKSDSVEMKAATTQMSAAQMQMTAARTQMAGGRMGGFGGLGGGRGSPLQMVGRGAAVPLAMGATMGGRMAASAFPGGRGIGRNMVRGMASQMQQGAREAMRMGGSALRGGLGLISRAFWPAFIAIMVGELAAAPIGGFIKSNTSFKRLGEAWEQGLFEGLAATFQTIAQGTDAFVNRPDSYTFGAGARESQLPVDAIKWTSRATDSVAEVNEMMNAIDVDAADGKATAFKAQRLVEYLNETIPELQAYSEIAAEHLGGFDSGLINSGQVNALKSEIEDAGVKLEWHQEIGLAIMGFLGDATKVEAYDTSQMDEGAFQKVRQSLNSYIALNDALDEENQLTETELMVLRDTVEQTSPLSAEQKARMQEIMQKLRDGFERQVLNAQLSLNGLLLEAISGAGLGTMNIPGAAIAGTSTDQKENLVNLMGSGVPDFLKQFGVQQATGFTPGEKQGFVDTKAPAKEQKQALEDARNNFNVWFESQEDLVGEAGMSAARAYVLAWSEEFDKTEPLSDRKRLQLLRKMAPDLVQDFKPGKKLDRGERAFIDQQFTTAERRLDTAGGISGADQLEQQANEAQKVLKAALLSGNVETLGADFYALLADGIGAPEEDVKKRMGNAVAGAVMAAVNEAGGVGKGKKKDKKLNNKLGDILAGMMPEDEVPESLKGKIDAVVGTMVDEYEAADTPKEKNKLQRKLKKLLPDEIFTWEDVKSRMEGEDTAKWDEKFTAMANAATEGVGDKGAEIIANLIDPISEGVENWISPTTTFYKKVDALAVAAVKALNDNLPSLRAKVQEYLNEVNKLASAENSIASGEGGGGGDTGDEKDVSGGAGLSFESNAEALGDVAGGADLSFAGNMAALDGAALASAAAPIPPVGGGADIPGDFGGGLFSGGDSGMGSGGGSEQNIFVQNMNLSGSQEDEASVLSQFAFMDPGGGGNA